MKLPVNVPVAAGRPFIALACEIAAGILRIIEDGWGRALASSDIEADDGEVEITGTAARRDAGSGQRTGDRNETSGL